MSSMSVGTSVTMLVAKQMLLNLLKQHSRVELTAVVEDITILTLSRENRVSLTNDLDDVRTCTKDGALNMLAFYADHKFVGHSVLLQVTLLSLL